MWCKKLTLVVFICSILQIYTDDGKILRNLNKKESADDSKNSQEDRAKDTGPKHLVNSKTELMAISQESAGQAAVLDFNNNLSGIFNGKTGAAYIFDFQKSKVVVLPGGSTDKTWNSSETTFNKYFQKMKNQKDLWELGQTNGIRFDASTVPESIDKELAAALGTFSDDYKSPCNVYGTYVEISKITADSLQKSLKGFFKVMGSVSTEERGDFKWLIGTYQGFTSFFDNIKGGIESLHKKRIQLDLSKILNQPSGIHIFDYFIKEIYKKIDVQKSLKSVANSEEEFFLLISKLSGETEYGIDGLFNSLSKIVSYINKKESKQNAKMALRAYFKNSKTDVKKVKKEFFESIELLLNTIKQLRLNKFSKLEKLLTNIKEKKWEFKDVNMSEVITILTTTESKDAEKGIKKIKKIVNKEEKT